MPALTLSDGQVVTYDDYGAGPRMMLVHGSPGTSSTWQAVGKRLSDRFRIVAPNLPGYGGTTAEAPGAPPSVSHAAALIEAVIRETGTPDVLAGHSYGGAVALVVALRAHVRPKALALFEPVCIPILLATGEAEAYASTKQIFDDYIRAFEGGDRQAARTMIDFWFGAGAFERMPGPLRDFLLDNSAANIHDVRASFRERYSPAAMRTLDFPVLTVYGSDSPDTSHRVASAVTALAPKASMVRVEGATHSLVTTHGAEVARLLAALAARDPALDQPEKV
jgi:pimeloyl-ACP methyl ester carboxylesterase